MSDTRSLALHVFCFSMIFGGLTILDWALNGPQSLSTQIINLF